MAKYETVQATHNSKHKQTQFASDDQVWNCTGNSQQQTQTNPVCQWWPNMKLYRQHTTANTNKPSFPVMTKYETVQAIHNSKHKQTRLPVMTKYETVQSTHNSKHKQTQFASGDNVWNCTGNTNSKHKQTQFASEDKVWNCTVNTQKQTQTNLVCQWWPSMKLYRQHTANTVKAAMAKYETVQSTQQQTQTNPVFQWWPSMKLYRQHTTANTNKSSLPVMTRYETVQATHKSKHKQI